MTTFVGTPGNDSILGSSGDDRFSLGRGGADTVDGAQGDDVFAFKGTFGADDQVEGGEGRNTLSLGWGALHTIVFGAASFHDISTLRVGGYSNLTLDDANVAADGTLTIAHESGPAFMFDGSQEADGHLVIRCGGNVSDDTLIGGASSDTIYGGAGDDILMGRDGDDHLRSGGMGSATLVGGAGQDEMRGTHYGRTFFVYEDIGQSTVSAPDLIRHVQRGDIIDLGAIDADTTQDGDQAFHLVKNLTGQASQLAQLVDSSNDQVHIVGDVDGDGQADFEIVTAGDQPRYGFIL